MKRLLQLTYLLCGLLLVSCTGGEDEKETSTETTSAPEGLTLEAESAKASEGTVSAKETSATLSGSGWLEYDLQIEESGRYKVEAITSSGSTGTVWIEDYVGNPDDRTYNITGNIKFDSENGQTVVKDGSPLAAGLHPVRVHFDGNLDLDKVKLTLLKNHKASETIMTQNMEGDGDWEIVWADEFDGEAIDQSKWVFDIGDWGWGNNELQYYTENRPENARIEDGSLIIEARKNDNGSEWTSTRMTTRGTAAFLYGKIDIRAKVPKEKGNWSAGWTLGNDYVDEKSWPYCGEIDIMESVGYEIDDATGNGKAHASIHCPDKYFKKNNQPTAIIDVENMETEYHNYTLEWSPTEIRAYVDDQLYFTYNDTTDELTWPYAKPHNIIINLAMGGGWGGAQGMNETVTSQKLIIDYVRVYQKN